MQRENLSTIEANDRAQQAAATINVPQPGIERDRSLPVHCQLLNDLPAYHIDPLLAVAQAKVHYWDAQTRSLIASDDVITVLEGGFIEGAGDQIDMGTFVGVLYFADVGYVVITAPCAGIS